MNATMANRRFWIGLLCAAGIVLGAEGAAFTVVHRATERAGDRWQVKLRERRQHETLVPAPTKEAAARLESDLAAARSALAQVTANLPAEEMTRIGEEARDRTATDVFFDLAAFVARMRQQAERRNVALQAGEGFGFSAFAEEPPPAEIASRIFRQRRFAEIVLTMLFEARPESLVAFQRDTPSAALPDRTGSSGGKIPAQRRERAATDVFALDPQLALRRPGIVESAAFRIVFTGTTETLRALLNALTTARLSIVVRSVEIERSGNESGSPLLRRPGTPASLTLGVDVAPEESTAVGPIPVVVPAASRFTVILEIVQLSGEVVNNVPAGPPVFG